MVDGLIRAFTLFQGFCLLMATILRSACVWKESEKYSTVFGFNIIDLTLFLVLGLCQQFKYSK